MTTCKILKTFPFSKNGISIQTATVGEERDDIPTDLIEGLEEAGCLSTGSEAKSVDSAPENKMADSPPENKEPDADSTPDGKEPDIETSEIDPEGDLIDNDPESETYWKKLSADSLKTLARQITDTQINNRQQAEEAIKAYLDNQE